MGYQKPKHTVGYQKPIHTMSYQKSIPAMSYQKSIHTIGFQESIPTSGCYIQTWQIKVHMYCNSGIYYPLVDATCSLIYRYGLCTLHVYRKPVKILIILLLLAFWMYFVSYFTLPSHPFMFIRLHFRCLCLVLDCKVHQRNSLKIPTG